MFQESFNGVSGKLHGCYMKVLGCFKEASRKLSGCFKKVSCCMALIAASRAEGGLVLLGIGYLS